MTTTAAEALESAPPEEATPPEETENVETEAGTEAQGDETTESGESGSQEEVPDFLAEVEDGDLSSHQRVQDLIKSAETSIESRVRESEKQSQLAKAQREVREREVSDSQKFISDEATKELQGLIGYAAKDADDEAVDGPRRERALRSLGAVDETIKKVTNAALVNGGIVLTENWKAHAKELNPDFKLSDEHEGRLETAVRDRRVFDEATVMRESIYASGVEAGRVEGRAAAEKDAKQTTQTASRAAQEEGAKARREAKPSPTRTGGGSTSEGRTDLDIILDPSSSWEDKEAANNRVSGLPVGTKYSP